MRRIRPKGKGVGAYHYWTGAVRDGCHGDRRATAGAVVIRKSVERRSGQLLRRVASREVEAAKQHDEQHRRCRDEHDEEAGHH